MGWPFKWFDRLGASYLEATRLFLNGTQLTATAAQLNNLTSSTKATASVGSTKVLVAADAAAVQQLDTLTGSVATLPAATGSGFTYEFIETVAATSNAHKVQVANGTDVMDGAITVVNDAAGNATTFGTTGATITRSDTVTLNRTTTGGAVLGGRMFFKDIKAGHWHVHGWVLGTGTIATPFSAAV